MTLTGSWWVVGRAINYQLYAHQRKKLVLTSWTPSSALQKNGECCGTSTRADACGCTIQTKNLRACFDSLVRVSRLKGGMCDSLVRVSSWVNIVRKLHICWDSLFEILRVSRHSWKKTTHVRLHGPCFATASMKEVKFKKLAFCLSRSGSLGLVVRTWKRKRGQDTRDNWHVRQRRNDEMMVVFFFGLNAVRCRPPGAVRCTPPSQTSEVRMPEPAACRSSRDQAVRLAWARRLTLRRLLWRGHRCGHAADANLCTTPGFMVARDADSAEDCRRRAFFITMSSSEPSRTERASVVVPCVWMHLLMLRKTRRAASSTCFAMGWRTARREGKGPSWRPGWPRWIGCWPCPWEGSTLVLPCSGSARRAEWPRAAGSQSSLSSSSLAWSGECATARAERSARACPAGHRPCWRRPWVSWPPSYFLAAELVWRPGGPTRSDALAGGLVDDHDSDCGDSLLIHQPAQLDEQPLHVGVLLLRDVELFPALGGRLVAHAHATQELLDPSRACTDVESLCVAPFVHQAPDRDRAEAQDAGHPRDVLAQPCHVCGWQQSSPAKRCFCWCASFLAVKRSVWVDPVEHLGAQEPSNAACPIAALSSTGGTCRGTSRARCVSGVLPCYRWARLQRVPRPGWPGRHRECWRWRSPRVWAVGRWSVLVATSPADASGQYAEAHGGGGCALAEHVPSAAACWADRALSYPVCRPTRRIEEVSEFHLRHYCKTKISRGSGHYFGIIRQSTGTAKWSKLYERS